MERSQFGLPGLLFSVAVAALAGIVTPAPAREAPPLVHQPDGQCVLAELACGYSVDTPETPPRPRAAIAPRR